MVHVIFFVWYSSIGNQSLEIIDHQYKSENPFLKEPWPFHLFFHTVDLVFQSGQLKISCSVESATCKQCKEGGGNLKNPLELHFDVDTFISPIVLCFGTLQKCMKPRRKGALNRSSCYK